jgi:ABC-type uncharacterized transport system substrate-binding protein
MIMIGRQWMGNAVALAALLLMGAPALAHPHLFVTIKSGSSTPRWCADRDPPLLDLRRIVCRLRRGARHQQDRHMDREELAPIAEVNISSKKALPSARRTGDRVRRCDRLLVRIQFQDATLTLNFTLPFAAPVRPRDLTLEIFDPMFFIEFSFEGRTPSRSRVAGQLHIEPGQCRRDERADSAQ